MTSVTPRESGRSPRRQVQASARLAPARRKDQHSYLPTEVSQGDRASGESVGSESQWAQETDALEGSQSRRSRSGHAQGFLPARGSAKEPTPPARRRAGPSPTRSRPPPPGRGSGDVDLQPGEVGHHDVLRRRARRGVLPARSGEHQDQENSSDRLRRRVPRGLGQVGRAPRHVVQRLRVSNRSAQRHRCTPGPTPSPSAIALPPNRFPPSGHLRTPAGDECDRISGARHQIYGRLGIGEAAGNLPTSR